jgi:hypothetical protein
MIKKITIKKIDTTKLDIKIQWKEMLKERIEKKINQENDWKQKK